MPDPEQATWVRCPEGGLHGKILFPDGSYLSDPVSFTAIEIRSQAGAEEILEGAFGKGLLSNQDTLDLMIQIIETDLPLRDEDVHPCQECQLAERAFLNA